MKTKTKKAPREKEYGHPFDDFSKTAGMLSALGYRFQHPEGSVLRHLTACDIPIMMSCVKLSREVFKHGEDNVADIRGYMTCLDRVHAQYATIMKQTMIIADDRYGIGSSFEDSCHKKVVRIFESQFAPGEMTPADLPPLEAEEEQLFVPGMVLIPAGPFQMGDACGDGEGGSDELLVHPVTVSAFYMDRYEVTKALWDDVRVWALAHGYTFDNAGDGKAANHPVHTVSWYDVVKWCNARSEQEGRVPAYYTSATQATVYRTGQVDVQNEWVKWGVGYRLPTEAEWEKAARGGLAGQRFPWGDTISHSQANYYSSTRYSYDVSATREYHPVYANGAEPFTSPVGSFEPNGYGLYDMAGNVWEWCWDRYGGYGSGAQVDPRSALSGSDRVIRGGSWDYDARYCRVTNRYYYWPDGRDYDFGFRSVLPPGQP